MTMTNERIFIAKAVQGKLVNHGTTQQISYDNNRRKYGDCNFDKGARGGDSNSNDNDKNDTDDDNGNNGNVNDNDDNNINKNNNNT